MGMESIAFMRQNENPGTLTPSNFTVHVYPFTTLPDLISHIHPKFVIMATGRALFHLEEDAREALLQKFPTLTTILNLSMAWSSILVDRTRMEEDRSYWPPYNPGLTNDGDSGCHGDHDDYGGDNNDGEYKDKATQTDRLAIDGDNNIDTGTKKGRYTTHGKRRGKHHCSPVRTTVGHNCQPGTEGPSKEAQFQQLDPGPAYDVEIPIA